MSRRTKAIKAEIPQYRLEGFRPVHREERELVDFGYNTLDKQYTISGFELWSSAGLKSSMGPLKSVFYRVSITISGSVDVQLGLEHFTHRPGTVGFTALNQLFSKRNVSPDLFGYYVLFTADFLHELVAAGRLSEMFPFFDYAGVPFFQLDATELKRVEQFILLMNDELHTLKAGREKAIQMYLYLLLLEAKRSYERQQLAVAPAAKDNHYLATRFLKLVSEHFLTSRMVAEYADRLSVTANHLNRVVKDVTGSTASDAIAEMLLQEAKAILRYTDASIAEVAYQLNFSDPAAFSRFFKKKAGLTPQEFRAHA